MVTLECWHYFAIFHVVWGVIIVRYLNTMFREKLDYILKEDKEYAKNFEVFRRKDINLWNRYEIYFGAITLLPYRVLLIALSIIFCGIWCTFFSLGVNLKAEMSPIRKKLINFVSRLTPRFILFLAGYYYIET